MRYTEYVERKFPPSSDRQTSLILFSFSFPLFFRTAKALRRSGIPLPGAERFRLSGRAVSRRNKSFKLCSKTVHTLRDGVRYTNIVSKGSRNPESIVIYNLLFLFYPLYFVKWSKTPRFRFPHGAGVFSCLGVSLKWLSRVLVYIVKNISRSVHDLFTIKGRLRDIL